MAKNSFIICLILLLMLTTPCFAGQSSIVTSSFVAVAVHIDTANKDIIGVDLLEAGINKFIQYKSSLVMMDGMILSGSSVLRELKKAGIDDFSNPNPTKLQDFGKINDVSYVLLLTLYPLDISADIKAFDVSKGDYLVGKKITQPKEAESKFGFMDTMLNKFSRLIDGELDEIFKIISINKS
ncbi:hypothetical protein SRRS_22730 [Sporomusa rhizae]|uniref:hypothetical protein n=1 Tax=Sporomusa rhizae TaxID=357999 RepID=UPI00352B5816